MSLSARYMNDLGIGANEVPTLRRKMKVRFIDLLRPDHGYGFVGLSTQQAMALFQWMIKTSAGYPGVKELLSCKGTCINFTQVDPLGKDWIEDLRARFLCALLDVFLSRGAHRWRTEQRIDINSIRWVPIRYYGGGRGLSDREVRDQTHALFQFAERRFLVSPNPSWPQADVIFAVRLHVYGDTYALELVYGCDEDRGSSWDEWVRSHKGEVFIDFVQRATIEIEAQLHPRP